MAMFYAGGLDVTINSIVQIEDSNVNTADLLDPNLYTSKKVSRVFYLSNCAKIEKKMSM